MVIRGVSPPFSERRLTLGGREWAICAVPQVEDLLGQVETDADLEAFPYGLLLWPSAIALAERLAAEPSLVLGKRVLELGAGPGLPGLVAQSLGARVTQTDYQDTALALARTNAARNGVSGIEYQTLDWRSPPPLLPFDVVLASDVLYERRLHDALSELFPAVLAPGGILLLTDPMRPASLPFLDRLETEGWKWQMEGHRVFWRGADVEIALFTARQG